MRLTTVRVQNFRSIVDSEPVSIDDRVTVVVGKNEQGKTTFLRGMVSFNESYAYSPEDMPHHLRPTLETRSKASIPIISLWLAPDAEERLELARTIIGVDAAVQIKATRFFDGHYEFAAVNSEEEESTLEIARPDLSEFVSDLKNAATGLKDRLPSHAARHSPFASVLPQAVSHLDNFVGANFDETAKVDDLVKTLVAALKGVPNQDSPIQSEVAQLTQQLQATYEGIQGALSEDRRSYLKSRLPRFVFHSTATDTIPNSVALSEFTKDPEATSKGMANLCRAAGLSVQKIQELASAPEPGSREPYEDHYRTAVSGAINEFWTQQTYTIFFRIDSERLSISVQDQTYQARIRPSDRSDGFRWYLSFYCALLNEVRANEPTILLLDNPGLELHPDGQRDIKRALEQRHSTAMQVIYVTHSPAMIDPYNLEQVRRVDLLEKRGGTKVRQLQVAGALQTDLLEPVRSAIGASLVTTLMTNRYNILAEGAADRPILEAALMTFAPNLADQFAVSGSIAETVDMLPIFLERENLPYVIYLDSDDGGRSIEAKLLRAGIPKAKIASLRDCLGTEFLPGNDIELEDVVSDNLYAQAVSQVYGGKSVTVQPESSGKRGRRYMQAYKDKHQIRFNKRRVAERLKELITDDAIDDTTRDRLRTITTKLTESVIAQTRIAQDGNEQGEPNAGVPVSETSGI